MHRTLLLLCAELYCVRGCCLSEDTLDKLRRCARLDLDCADICATTGAVASRRTESSEQVLLQLLEVCANVCQLCAEECEEHASHHATLQDLRC